MCNHIKNRKGVTLNNKHAHQKDHKNWSRRGFLSSFGMLSAGSLMLNNLSVSTIFSNPLIPLINSSNCNNILVIIRLKGGNDSLNMVVPSGQYGHYQTARPNIRIAENNLFDLGLGWGLPNYMINPTISSTNLSNLDNMWGNGSMAIMHSVGHLNMSQSHFEGENNWATASGGSVNLDTGWLGRYFNEVLPNYLQDFPNIPPAIHIGVNIDSMFDAGNGNMAYLIKSIESLNQIVSSGTSYNVNNLPDCLYGSELGYVRNVANNTQLFNTAIQSAFEASNNYADYPDIDDCSYRCIGEKLSIIARLIKGNLGTKIFMVDMVGYDTHNLQNWPHQKLLENLAEAVSAFYNDLEFDGHDGRVLTMTMSEFGRKIRENGSLGTDHGNAGSMLMFGPGLTNGGFYGAAPNLAELNLNDPNVTVPFQLDYRDVYYTVLKNWLCVDPQLLTLLLGDSYNEVPGLLSEDTSIDDCPNFQNLDNQTLDGNQTLQSKQKTSSNGLVPHGSDITLKSGYRVKLNNGFKTDPNIRFKVRVEPCDAISDKKVDKN